jgi:hypothetical protein
MLDRLTNFIILRDKTCIYTRQLVLAVDDDDEKEDDCVFLSLDTREYMHRCYRLINQVDQLTAHAVLRHKLTE